MAKRFKTGRLKKNQAYSVIQLARSIGATEATVRLFLRQGMGCIDDNRPVLILGFQAKEFLDQRYAKAKSPLKIGEFYCLGCKAPRMPDGRLADYIQTTGVGGRLQALCEVCGSLCNRPIGASQYAAFSEILDIAKRDGG